MFANCRFKENLADLWAWGGCGVGPDGGPCLPVSCLPGVSVHPVCLRVCPRLSL